jgi:hypothetical protein
MKYKGTINVKVSLCLIKYQPHREELRASGGLPPHISNLGTRRNCVARITLRRLTPGEGAPVAHQIEGQVGPKAGLDAAEKTFRPVPGIGPQFLTIVTELSLLYTGRNRL